MLEMDLSGISSDGDLGFELVGGRDDPYYPNDSGIYVASVAKGSIVDGKLRFVPVHLFSLGCKNWNVLFMFSVKLKRGNHIFSYNLVLFYLSSNVYLHLIIPNIYSVNKNVSVSFFVLFRKNDCITHVKNLDCTSVSRRMVIEAIRSSGPVVHMVIRRKRSPNWSSQNSQHVVRTPPGFQNNSKVARWIYTAGLAAGCHGLSLESGVFISRISEGSLAAKDCSLVIGDRVLRINNKSMDGLESIHEAMSILNDDRADMITITTLKMTYLDPECTTNVFMPAQRFKKENRSSQTVDLGQEYRSDYDRRYLPHEKNSGAWLKEKLDMVRGRRNSKDRNRNEEKKKYRNSSPNTLDLSTNTFEQDQAIGVLDNVIDSYLGGNTNTMKKNKRHSKEMSSQEKNGGTWPKARATNMLQNETGTIVARKKDRPPLSLLINSNQNDEYFCSNNINRNSTPVNISQNTNRHSMCKSFENQAHFPKVFSNVNDSCEKLKVNKMCDYEGQRDVNNRLSVNLKSDDSLNYSLNKPNLISEKDILNYYRKNRNCK